MSKEENDTLLTEAALAEFSAKPYEKASVNAIIEKSGLSKGSFYYRYANKLELYVHLLRVCAAEKWRFIHENMSRPVEQCLEGDIFDLFGLQLKIAQEFSTRHPQYHQLYRRFSKERGTKHYREAMEALALQDDAGLEEMISAARNNGELGSHYSTEFMTSLIGHLLSSFQDIFGPDEDRSPSEREQVMGELISFLRHGLGRGRDVAESSVDNAQSTTPL